MLAEEFIVLDPASSLWSAVRPLLEVALRLEQQDDEHGRWHGWSKGDIELFLKALPQHCTLLVGVWDDGVGNDKISGPSQTREALVVGFVCEVHAGEVQTLRTFEALRTPDTTDLPPIEELEPGYQHAFSLLRAARTQIAPVAWAIFTDWATWNEWVYGLDEQAGELNKGEVLAALARQGRCVLMGSQTSHHHP